MIPTKRTTKETGTQKRYVSCLGRLLPAAILVIAGCEAQTDAAACGNGILEASEVCDGSHLSTHTCYSLTGSSGGQISCLPDCTDFDISGCTSCGNGSVEDTEDCDGSMLDGHTCEDLGFPAGGLRCDGECRLDTSGCGEAIPSCGDDNCNGIENPVTCQLDCGFECDAQGVGGMPRDYIVHELQLPQTSSEGADMGLDLDGDGAVDNKLGAACGLMAAQFAPSNAEQYSTMIQTGDFVLLTRIWLNGFVDDDLVMGQLYKGELVAPPMFDGSDQASIVTGSDLDTFSCGALADGELLTGGGQVYLPIPLCLVPQMSPVELKMRAAGMYGHVDENGFLNLVVGGAVSREDIHTFVFPAMSAHINMQILDDPYSAGSQTLADLFDGNCDSMVPGCEGQVPHAGECLEEDPSYITVTELRCNALLHSVLAPDVVIDGEELLSVGWKMSGVPVTVTP